MLPLATGARLGTMTLKLCVAEAPCGSVAIAVTAAAPLDTARIVSMAPCTVAVATAGSLDDALYVRASPSGSVK